MNVLAIKLTPAVLTCIAMLVSSSSTVTLAGDCPFPWAIGDFRYTSTTGEVSTVTFEAIDKNSIRGNWRGSKGETASEVAGWHGASQKIVIAGYESDGSYWHLDCPNVSKSGFSGKAIFGDRDGTQSTGEFKLTLKSEDVMVTHFAGTDQDGKAVTIDARFERIDTTSSPEDFREFGKLMVGRWSSDITLIAPWPGQDKKAGEKITGYANRRWVSDRRAVVATTTGGSAIGNEFWTYDPENKHIKLYRTDSGGTHIQVTVWKETPSRWAWKVAGGQLDGQQLSGTGHWIFQDNNRTAILQGDVSLGGKPLPKLKDLHTRLDD